MIINSVQREEEAREVFGQINSVVKRFLDRDVDYLGHIERDPHVTQAVRSQVLVAHRFPECPREPLFPAARARNVASRQVATPSQRTTWFGKSC